MAETTELTRTIEGALVPQPGTYVLDVAHTVVGFVVRHLMVSKVRGTFQDFAGSITVDEDPARSGVEATIEVASVHTRDPQRDAHLRSGDFFEAERYPTMTFSSTGVRRSGDHWSVDGNLTIRDVTRPVTLELEFNGAIADPYGGTRIGFSAHTEIDREDYGMTFNTVLESGGVAVSKRVQIELEVEAVLQA